MGTHQKIPDPLLIHDTGMCHDLTDANKGMNSFYFSTDEAFCCRDGASLPAKMP